MTPDPLSGFVDVPAAVVEAIVARTEGVSAAFIKELMRRSVQFHLERADTGRIELPDVEAVLEEMLFGGGSLNRKLLGGNWDGQATGESAFAAG